jgi:hypothetical protein
LHAQSQILFDGDRNAPNRLLFDARAFLACGTIAEDASLRAAASQFVAEFVRSATSDGWFLEGGGWDTSYQAVSLDIGMDVVSLLPSGSARSELEASLGRGAAWLAARVLPDGRVDSQGNRRTCSGGESFLGEPKQVALTSVVLGLARVAVARSASADSGLLAASRLVSGWARANPGGNSCFERRD